MSLLPQRPDGGTRVGRDGDGRSPRRAHPRAHGTGLVADPRRWSVLARRGEAAESETTTEERRRGTRRADRGDGRRGSRGAGSGGDHRATGIRRRRAVHPLRLPVRARLLGRLVRHLGPPVARPALGTLSPHRRGLASGVAPLHRPGTQQLSRRPGGLRPGPALDVDTAERPPMDPDDTAAVQYTHSGTRYLLGYGRRSSASGTDRRRPRPWRSSPATTRAGPRRGAASPRSNRTSPRSGSAAEPPRYPGSPAHTAAPPATPQTSASAAVVTGSGPMATCRAA